MTATRLANPLSNESSAVRDAHVVSSEGKPRVNDGYCCATHMQLVFHFGPMPLRAQTLFCSLLAPHSPAKIESLFLKKAFRPNPMLIPLPSHAKQFPPKYRTKVIANPLNQRTLQVTIVPLTAPDRFANLGTTLRGYSFPFLAFGRKMRAYYVTSHSSRQPPATLGYSTSQFHN